MLLFRVQKLKDLKALSVLVFMDFVVEALESARVQSLGFGVHQCKSLLSICGGRLRYGREVQFLG